MAEILEQAAESKGGQGKLIKIGDTVVVSQAKAEGLHWDTSGNFVTLSGRGNGKDVVLTVSAHPGGPSAPLGAVLKTNSYIRLVSPRHPAPNGDLIAFRSGPDGDKVRIGNFERPDPVIDNVFFVAKISGSQGPEIRRGDHFKIRGVSRDPWVTYPDGAVAGTALSLDEDMAKAKEWVFGRFGDDGDDD